MADEDYIYKLQYDVDFGTYSVRVSLGDFIVSRTLKLPVLSNVVLDADDVILKSKYERRVCVWKQPHASSRGCSDGSYSRLIGWSRSHSNSYENARKLFTMDYEIERTNEASISALPLSCNPFTCASIYCSCGFFKSYRTT